MIQQKDKNQSSSQNEINNSQNKTALKGTPYSRALEIWGPYLNEWGRQQRAQELERKLTKYNNLT